MRIDKEQLQFDTTDRAFFACVSDLGRNFRVVKTLTVVNTDGREFVFDHTDTLRDCDGDVTTWVYKPTADTVARYDMLRGWSLELMND